MKNVKASAAAIAAVVLISACSSSNNNMEKSGVELVTIADTTLMLSDVERQLPAGISSADSIVMTKKIVEAWIKDNLLKDIAINNIADMESIERRVADYRNRLILMEYMSSMAGSRAKSVSDNDIKQYYAKFGDEMLLERPLVKGVYLKVSADADRLDQVRDWVANPSQQSIDRLEKYGLKEAMQYDYFMTRWVDWSRIVDQIPYRFEDADEFVATHRNFETTKDGALYLLHISDYLKSGEKMPYSFAVSRIKEILEGVNISEYQDRLMKELLTKAVKEGKVKIKAYDLRKGEIKKL